MSRKYYISTLKGAGDLSWEPVEGTPVQFENIPGKWFAYQCGSGWRIGEASAGAYLQQIGDRKDMQSAISVAKTYLDRQGPEEVARVIAKAIEKFGGAPKCN